MQKCYNTPGKECEGIMFDIIKDTLIDSIKLFPFLFITFIIIELIEHKLGGKSKEKLKSSNYGPIVGSLLGIVPQCGFGASAVNLYITRIISLGTLIAIFLSTSDEMLPVLIANQVSIVLIIKILLIKIVIGILCGIVIDIIIKPKKEIVEHFKICDDDHCDCEHSIVRSSLKHTLNILIFIIIISFILNYIITLIPSKTLESLFYSNNVLGPIISSLIGLIPNCSASVLITQLYIDNIISFGTTMSGLLSGSGVALLVLFKQNKNIKENIFILLILYIIGVISGIILNII